MRGFLIVYIFIASIFILGNCSADEFSKNYNSSVSDSDDILDPTIDTDLSASNSFLSRVAYKKACDDEPVNIELSRITKGLPVFYVPEFQAFPEANLEDQPIRGTNLVLVDSHCSSSGFISLEKMSEKIQLFEPFTPDVESCWRAVVNAVIVVVFALFEQELMLNSQFSLGQNVFINTITNTITLSIDEVVCPRSDEIHRIRLNTFLSQEIPRWLVPVHQVLDNPFTRGVHNGDSLRLFAQIKSYVKSMSTFKVCNDTPLYGTPTWKSPFSPTGDILFNPSTLNSTESLALDINDSASIDIDTCIFQVDVCDEAFRNSVTQMELELARAASRMRSDAYFNFISPLKHLDDLLGVRILFTDMDSVYRRVGLSQYKALSLPVYRMERKNCLEGIKLESNHVPAAGYASVVLSGVHPGDSPNFSSLLIKQVLNTIGFGEFMEPIGIFIAKSVSSAIIDEVHLVVCVDRKQFFPMKNIIESSKSNLGHSMSRQIIQGLNTLHQSIGIPHGELNIDSFLVRYAEPNNLISENVGTYVGRLGIGRFDRETFSRDVNRMGCLRSGPGDSTVEFDLKDNSSLKKLAGNSENELEIMTSYIHWRNIVHAEYRMCTVWFDDMVAKNSKTDLDLRDLWLAPEIVESVRTGDKRSGKTFSSFAADIWAFGILYLQLIGARLEVIIGDENQMDQKYNCSISNRFEDTSVGMKIDTLYVKYTAKEYISITGIKDETNNLCTKAIIKGCLKRDPSQRISVNLLAQLLTVPSIDHLLLLGPLQRHFLRSYGAGILGFDPTIFYELQQVDSAPGIEPKIFKAQLRGTDRFVAIKKVEVPIKRCMNKYFGEVVTDSANSLLKEHFLMKQASSSIDFGASGILPVIQTYINFSASTEKLTCYMVMPISLGDAATIVKRDLIQQRHDYILRIIKSCLNAIKKLHEEGYTHGDIKASNMLLLDSGKWVLSGFDNSEHVIQNMLGHSVSSANSSRIPWKRDNDSGSPHKAICPALIPSTECGVYAIANPRIHFVKDIRAVGEMLLEIFSLVPWMKSALQSLSNLVKSAFHTSSLYSQLQSADGYQMPKQLLYYPKGQLISFEQFEFIIATVYHPNPPSAAELLEMSIFKST